MPDMKTDLHLRTRREGQSLYISRSKGCLGHSLQKHTQFCCKTCDFLE